jgi:hypothetical protein
LLLRTLEAILASAETEATIFLQEHFQKRPGFLQWGLTTVESNEGLIKIHHIHHHHHVAIKEFGHWLTHSGLTQPEVSSVVLLGYFCFFGVFFYQSG